MEGRNVVVLHTYGAISNFLLLCVLQDAKYLFLSLTGIHASLAY